MSFQKEVIPIEELLASIEGENPSGMDLRYSGLYDEIREARPRDARGDWDWNVSAEDSSWDRIISIATDALRGKTKDLCVSAWLVEALAVTKGFAGVRDGLKLTRLFIDKFWDTLYPIIDDGDLEARANALTWLDRQLETTIREMPVTESPTGPNYSYNQWQGSRLYQIPEITGDQSAEDLEWAQFVRDRAAREDKITSEQWRIAREGTSTRFYEELKTQVMECWEELRLLDSAVDAHFGLQAPELIATRKSLKDLSQLLDAPRQSSV